MELDKTSMLKAIVLDRERNAKFSHAIAGVLYYTVENDAGKYMFPIDMNDKEDVGSATFDKEIKAVTLMRYMRKAIDNDSMIKIS